MSDPIDPRPREPVAPIIHGRPHDYYRPRPPQTARAREAAARRSAPAPPAGADRPRAPADLALIPVLRGVSHVHSTYVAAIAGAALVVLAADATARWCSVAYTVALVALFGFSGLLHRWRRDPRWEPLLRRLDHCTIFAFIATCVSLLAIQVLSGPAKTAALALAWAGAGGGVTLSLAWIDAPRTIAAGSYVLVSCAAVVGVPQMTDRLSPAPLALLAAGGLLYAVGAVVYATRRPDPWPRTFGFHEVFHALVIAGAGLHFAALAGWILRTPAIA